MAKKFRVEMQDGRVFQVEADSQPSEAEILDHLSKQTTDPTGDPDTSSLPKVPAWWPRDKFGNPISTEQHPLDELGQPANAADRVFNPHSMGVAQGVTDILGGLHVATGLAPASVKAPIGSGLARTGAAFEAAADKAPPMAVRVPMAATELMTGVATGHPTAATVGAAGTVVGPPALRGTGTLLRMAGRAMGVEPAVKAPQIPPDVLNTLQEQFSKSAEKRAVDYQGEMRDVRSGLEEQAAKREAAATADAAKATENQSRLDEIEAAKGVLKKGELSTSTSAKTPEGGTTVLKRTYKLGTQPSVSSAETSPESMVKAPVIAPETQAALDAPPTVLRVKAAKMPVEDIVPSPVRNRNPSGTPNMSVGDMERMGVDPSLRIKTLTPGAAEAIVKARAAGRAAHISEAEMNKALEDIIANDQP